jgi:hypothetical protein
VGSFFCGREGVKFFLMARWERVMGGEGGGAGKLLTRVTGGWVNFFG